LFQERVAAGSPLRLSRNYRSQEGILRFVDLIFGDLWKEAYSPMIRPPEVMDFEAESTAHYSGVEIWKHLERDSDLTAHYVLDLLNEGIARRDVCVLVRDSAGALDMQRGLLGQGIDCRIAGGTERFYTRLEVRDLANALRAVSDPYDDFALIACLRSPMVGVSLDTIALLAARTPVVEAFANFETPVEADAALIAEFRAWFEPLQRYADRLSAWEVLSEIFARSHYLPALAKRPNGAQLLANVRKLLALATSDPELGPAEFADRIREIQQIRHKEGDAPSGAEDADVVTIMTIHKAKGLEFPVVVLPETYAKITKPARELVVEPRLGVAAAKYLAGDALFHRFLSDAQRRRTLEEEVRVLHVALTRAKSRLCVCLYDTKSRDTVSGLLRAPLKSGDLPGLKVVDLTNTDKNAAG
jgi:ATP-dependent helicase/nuclease subunit A